jgi:DNA-binding NtrC family response regulator
MPMAMLNLDSHEVEPSSQTRAVVHGMTASEVPQELYPPTEACEPLSLGPLPSTGIDLRATVEAFETRMILEALARTGWNKNRASRLLGLNRTTLVEMIKRKRLAPQLAAQ